MVESRNFPHRRHHRQESDSLHNGFAHHHKLITTTTNVNIFLKINDDLYLTNLI